MTQEQVSQGEQVSTEGVTASEPQDTNDYKAMAANAQSGHDKYVNLTQKYGDNFEQKLEGFSEFERQWTDNPGGTIENLQKQAGIKVNKVQEQPITQEEANVWEILQEGSTANRTLENKISTVAQKAADEAVTKYKEQQQVNEWRQILNEKGITDYTQQNAEIRKFLNPNPDFRQFADGLGQPNQPQQETPTPQSVLSQVQHSQSQPQSTGVLQGSGMPPKKSWADERVKAVEDIAKQKRNMDNF